MEPTFPCYVHPTLTDLITMDGFFEWVKKALSESDGTPSSLRPPFWYHEAILGVCILLVVLFTLWSHFNDSKFPFNPAPLGSVLAGWFAINRGSKIVQRGIEPSSPPFNDSKLVQRGIEPSSPHLHDN